MACLFFLSCVHYIKIFFFISFSNLCALNSVLWTFLRFFLDLKFDFPLLEYMKITRSWFSMYSGGKMSIFKSRKNQKNYILVLFLFTGPIILAKGMIWYNVYFHNMFFEKCLRYIWETRSNTYYIQLF